MMTRFPADDTPASWYSDSGIALSQTSLQSDVDTDEDIDMGGLEASCLIRSSHLIVAISTISSPLSDYCSTGNYFISFQRNQ